MTSPLLSAPDPFEKVTVDVLGESYTEWEKITIHWSRKDQVITVVLGTTEIGDYTKGPDAFTKWNFPPGVPIVLYSNGTPLVAAIVDLYEPAATPTSHTVTIVARTITKYLVDNSVNPELLQGAGAFSQMTYEQLIQALSNASLGPQIDCHVPACQQLVKSFQLRQGATGQAEIMRVLPNMGATAMGDNLTDTVHIIGLGDTSVVDTGGFLLQGLNFENFGGKLSYLSRTNKIDVIAQDGADPTLIQAAKGTALDNCADPRRYQRIISQQAIDSMTADRRATWEILQRIAYSTRVQIETPGWRVWGGDGTTYGPLYWQPNQLVWVRSTWLKIDCAMLIETVEFNQDDAKGTTTTLSLVDPRTGGINIGNTRCNSVEYWMVC